MKRKLIKLLLGITLLAGGNVVNSDPSKIIAQAMKTPASLFDVFLFQMHSRFKCESNYWTNRKVNDICITNITYDFDDNIVTISMFTRNSKHLKDFDKKSKKEKSQALMRIMERSSVIAGVTGLKNSNPNTLSFIGETPVRNNWKEPSFDTVKFKQELAKRTNLVLVVETLYSSEFLHESYLVKRNHNGDINIEKK